MRRLVTAAAVTVLVVLVGAFMLPVKAHGAEPVMRGLRCVSKYESLHPHGHSTRPDLERYWGVRGLGVERIVPLLGSLPVWTYPLCEIPLFVDGFAYADFGPNGLLRSSGYVDQGH